MTVVIILREAFLKNNSIEVIKRLKLSGFKCKNDFKKILTAGSTFRNEFDLSLYLLQLLKIDNIEVIKSLKLTGFKCKNDFTKNFTSGSTFRNEFDLSLNLLQVLKI